MSSSFIVNNLKMMHAAVNTDPLQLVAKDENRLSHYGLKERYISHVKINEMKELHVWYEFGDKLGQGGFGTVTEVTEKDTDVKWAMKSVSKRSGERLKLLQQEIQVLKLIEHPHIIYLDKIFESSKYMYMIFEKCHGDFAKVYQERKPFTEEISKKILSELVDAVAYLHKYEIVHRDLKLENILLGENPADPSDEYYIKLTDFGLAVVKTGSGVESMLHDYCGTLHYMAPEVITYRSYSQTCDMWSVGVILYMLVTGNYPFQADCEDDIKNSICYEDPTFINVTLTNEARDLIFLLLVKDPVHRIRATEVLQHPWVLNERLSTTSQNKGYNILDKMKEWKSEMKVETGAASDWISPESSQNPQLAKINGKEAMSLPKTNISFSRNRKSSRNSVQIMKMKEKLK